MFRDSGIILSEKIFSDFQTNLSPDIAMRSQRQKLPLLVIREGRLSLFGSHGKGTGPRVSHCIAMRECQTPVEVKNVRSQKNFQLCFKTGFLHISGLWDNFNQKKSDFQTNLSPVIAMRPQRQKLLSTCNLSLLVIREGGLSVFGSHGKGTGPWVSHYIVMRECQVKKFSTFFQNGFCPCFRTLG